MKPGHVRAAKFVELTMVADLARLERKIATSFGQKDLYSKSRLSFNFSTKLEQQAISRRC
jgi:hypothetical protein